MFLLKHMYLLSIDALLALWWGRTNGPGDTSLVEENLNVLIFHPFCIAGDFGARPCA